MGRHKKPGRKKTLDARIVKKHNKMARDNYHREKMTGISFRLSNESDKDVIERIKEQQNKADYFRKLIRDDISKK